MDKRILVTGAAGFIGFHLSRALKRRGDAVIGFDNFNSYYRVDLKHLRAEVLGQEGIEVIQGDICDPYKLNETLQREGISHVVHLAAQAGVRYSLVDPQAYIKANIEGFVTILEGCRKGSLPLVFASSSSVYGANDTIPFAVGDRTDHQVSLYGATKKSNELMAFTYHHLFKIPVTGLRFFTVYGPWGRPDMAYFSFADAIRKGHPIELYNNGDMKRDFTYIDDIVEGTLAAIDRESPYEIFNLGNHQPENVSQLVAYLEEFLGKKAKVVFQPMPPGDVPITYADITSSSRKLNYLPKTTLRQGVKQFVDWYQNFV